MTGMHHTSNLERWYKGQFDWLLLPLFRMLTSIGVAPSQISHARLIIGLAGAGVMALHSPFTGAGIILLALIMDSIDGGLARFQKVMSHRGTFVDRVCDYTLYFATVLALLWKAEVGPFAAAYHIYIFFAAVILSILKRNEGKKTDWIINPTANLVGYMIAWYASLFLWAFLDWHIAEKTIFWLNALLTLVAIETYLIVHNRWFGPGRGMQPRRKPHHA